MTVFVTQKHIHESSRKLMESAVLLGNRYFQTQSFSLHRKAAIDVSINNERIIFPHVGNLGCRDESDSWLLEKTERMSKTSHAKCKSLHSWVTYEKHFHARKKDSNCDPSPQFWISRIQIDLHVYFKKEAIILIYMCVNTFKHYVQYNFNKINCSTHLHITRLRERAVTPFLLSLMKVGLRTKDFKDYKYCQIRLLLSPHMK